MPNRQTETAEMPAMERRAVVSTVDAEQRTIEVTWTTGALSLIHI